MLLVRRLIDDEGGLSLVELMIAIFMLAVGLLALAGVAVSSLASLRHSRDVEEATNVASSTLESVRARQFDDIVLDAGDATVAALSGCFDGEPVVDDAVATPVTHVDATTFAPFTVTTYVTWTQAAGGGCSGAERLTKRVRAVVTWTDRDQNRSLTNETIVSSSERGLPVPAFQMSPTSAEANIDHARVVAGTAKTCLRHQLRNIGAADTYDWTLHSFSRNGVADTPTKATDTQFTSVNTKWTVTAWFETPATSTADDPSTVTPTTAGPVQMTDTDGNKRPEENIVVQSREIANVWFCYTPPTTESNDVTVTAVARVHSRFDANRYVDVSHTITISTLARTLYLFDRDDTQAHARGVVQNSKTTYPPYRMGPQDGLAGSPENLGSIIYDWDSDLDVDALGGIRLPGKSTTTFPAEAAIAAWHEQFLEATTLKRNATLTIWASTTDALKNTVFGNTQQLDVRLLKLPKNESTTKATLLATGTVSWTQSVNGWTQVDIPIDFGANVSFAANEFLRLEVSCANSTVDCHLGYDNATTTPSALKVQVA